MTMRRSGDGGEAAQPVVGSDFSEADHGDGSQTEVRVLPHTCGRRSPSKFRAALLSLCEHPVTSPTAAAVCRHVQTPSSVFGSYPPPSMVPAAVGQRSCHVNNIPRAGCCGRYPLKGGGQWRWLTDPRRGRRRATGITRGCPSAQPGEHSAGGLRGKRDASAGGACPALVLCSSAS